LGLTHKKCPCKCLKLIGKEQLHCAGIGYADDWAVVLVNAPYGASAAAYAG